MNLTDLGTQLLFTTVPIFVKLNNGRGNSAGTGFIFSYNTKEMGKASIPLLITNYHVVENAESGYIEFNLQENGEPVLSKSVKVTFDHTTVTGNKLGELDLVAIPIGKALEDLASKGFEVFFRSVSMDMIPDKKVINNFSAIEDLTFIGYPSGLYDEKNHLSIIRKGITATPLWSNHNGKPDFLIDGGVYPGSSGSPVIKYNQGSYATDSGITIGTRLYFVGIIYQTTVRGETIYLNLARAINSWAFKNKINLLLKPMVDEFTKKSNPNK